VRLSQHGNEPLDSGASWLVFGIRENRRDGNITIFCYYYHYTREKATKKTGTCKWTVGFILTWIGYKSASLRPCQSGKLWLINFARQADVLYAGYLSGMNNLLMRVKNGSSYSKCEPSRWTKQQALWLTLERYSAEMSERAAAVLPEVFSTRNSPQPHQVQHLQAAYI
jgi:hypothetical protein